MSKRPHNLSLDQIDAIMESVRRETDKALHQQASRIAVAPSAERSEPDGAPAGAPSLEEATLKYIPTETGFFPGNEKAGDVWTIKTQRYASGIVITRATLFGVWTPPRAKSSDASSAPLAREQSVHRFEQSIQRSKRLLRERCYALDADHLLTLTKRGKFSNCDELWKVFWRFNRYMTDFYGAKWRYVAVPELHADGETYHMHVAINGFYWAGIVRRIWQKALGGTGHESGSETLGNVDLKAFRKRGANATAVRRIAGYISKYVGKGFVAGRASRRLFSSSRGLHPSHVTRFVIRDWLGIPEVVTSVQRWLCGLGADADGDCYHWSRTRSDDEKLLATGFILTSYLPRV